MNDWFTYKSRDVTENSSYHDINYLITPIINEQLLKSPTHTYINMHKQNFLISNEVKIPKIIMQTWKNDEIPEQWRESPKSIKKYMPDWNHVLMTDKDNDEFCRTYFPQFYPYFKNFPHSIQRADAIRAMWLYIHGGIYMDLDVVVRKPLDELFYSDSELYLCSSGNIGSYLTNSFMASKPGCKMWLDMIEHMCKPPPWWAVGKHMTVMNTTGPIALNNVVKKNKYGYQSLPSKLVMPCSVCNIEDCKLGDSYVKPLVGSSWVAWDTKCMNFFMCNWRKVLFVVILVIILIVLIIICFLYFRKHRTTIIEVCNRNYHNRSP